MLQNCYDNKHRDDVDHGPYCTSQRPADYELASRDWKSQQVVKDPLLGFFKDVVAYDERYRRYRADDTADSVVLEEVRARTAWNDHELADQEGEYEELDDECETA